MTLADMSTLEFKGTVDEIDVGKLHEGMPVRIQIGALPGSSVPAKLTRIAPKAREKEGATIFDVEAAIDTDQSTVTLRAGYSANADVIIQEKKGVLLVPERLVTMEKDKASVEIPGAKPGGRAGEEGDPGRSLRRPQHGGRRRPRRGRQGRPAAGQGRSSEPRWYLRNYLRQFLRDVRAQKLRLFLTSSASSGARRR